MHYLPMLHIVMLKPNKQAMCQKVVSPVCDIFMSYRVILEEMTQVSFVVEEVAGS